jgi:hypothetical protein
MDEADLADERLIQQVDERPRREHPELFNVQGRLLRTTVAKLIHSLGGVQLNRDQVDEVIRLGREAAARRARKRPKLDTFRCPDRTRR